MKQFGLVGYPLGHSFSKKYFTKKFEKMRLEGYSYDLFEMKSLDIFPSIWLENRDLVGVNVTVPHKKNIMRYLNRRDGSAEKVGAVNVVHRIDGRLVGYNTDYLALKASLKKWLIDIDVRALILGTGGAAKASQVALEELDIDYRIVSRQKARGDYTYSDLKNDREIINHFKLIINTTPLGMYPNVDTFPDVPYEQITDTHYLFDLIYNPKQTTFLKKGAANDAKTKNGLEMLELQAELSWDIWTK